MPAISLQTFGGEIPRSPAALLPNNGSQRAINCDLTKGQLQPLKDGFLLATMVNNVKGIYTENGIHFFTWTVPVSAYKSPVINDTYNRVYYTTPTEFRVTVASLAQINGGTPSQSWLVGVPRPPGTLTLTPANRQHLPGDTNTTVTGVFYYVESNGTVSAESNVTLVAVGYLHVYTFSIAQAIPSGATAYLRVTIRNGTENQDVAIIIASGDPEKSTLSNSLPGGVTGNLTVAGNGTDYTLTMVWGNYEDRAYVVTYTNQWQEESEPSDAALVSVQYAQDVQVEHTFNPNTLTNYRAASKVRLYRAAGEGDYLYVKEESAPWIAGNVVIIDDLHLVDSGRTLPSDEWFLPAADLKYLTPLPNGFFAAAKGNIVYFSEPYRSHAWPYSTSLPYNVVGMEVIENALVVTTVERPYLISGVHPSAMSQTKINAVQAGISDQSMALLDNAVVYASNDGIVAVAGAGASLDNSQQLFTRRDWRTRYGAEFGGMQFSVYDGQLVVTNSVVNQSFMVRLDEAGGAFTRLDPTFKTDATFVLPLSDQMYYSVGTNIYQYQGGNDLTLDWWSKDFVLEEPYNMAVGWIDCTGPTTVTVYADNVQNHQVTMNTSGYFWLPGNKVSRTWAVRLQGQFIVKKVVIATSVDEIKQA